jgi:hypothetical protein
MRLSVTKKGSLESHRAVSHASSFRVADVPGETPYRSVEDLYHLSLASATGCSKQCSGLLLNQESQ